MSDRCIKNTDREIWREKEKDFYSPSIHVTEQGEIGINVGGYVIVKPIQDWHKCQGQLRLQIDVATGAKSIAKQLQKQSDLLTLGLMQEKNKVTKLYDVLTLILNENFSGQSTLSPYAKRQADEALDI